MIEGVKLFGMEGSPANSPATIRAAARPPQPIDIEALLQWAVARSGRLPWDLARNRELAFDGGVTAQLRRKPRMGWSLAEACAGLRLGGSPMPAMMKPGRDAERVVLAVRRLDPADAATVIACARAKIRPDWMPGVAPRLVERPRSHRKCKPGQKRSRMVWEPCDPGAVRAARGIYTRWHAAVRTLADTLRGVLDQWEINGFAASAEPWSEALKETA